MVVHGCELTTQEVESRRVRNSKVQGQPQQHTELEASKITSWDPVRRRRKKRKRRKRKRKRGRRRKRRKRRRKRKEEEEGGLGGGYILKDSGIKSNVLTLLNR
jgi:ribosomal protein L24